MKDIVQKIRQSTAPFWIQDGYATRFQQFQNLMRYRIRDVLIVSSLYDFCIFEEDGKLYELLRSEYAGLNLSHIPELTHVSSGKEALKLIENQNKFDLIITTLHIEDMSPVHFCKQLKRQKKDLPVVMLAFENRELADLILHEEDRMFDQIFIWQGDYRLMLAIIKHLEDKVNLVHDTRVMGVQSILLIEDNIRFYSSLISMLYVEVINQSRRVIHEGINVSQKNLRQRARPKILLCKTYEQAAEYFNKFHDTILCIISDIEFNKNGEPCSDAGLQFAVEVRERHPDIPILFQSSLESHEQHAKDMGCLFASKNTSDLNDTIRFFISNYLGFGDFVFRNADGTELGRAHDLLSLEKILHTVPLESIIYHASRNHFSNWLKARTEFWLAHEMRPKRTEDFKTANELRDYLTGNLRAYRKIRQRGVISDFDPELFDPATSISKIGKGSPGGKARGMGFFHTLINNYNIQDYFEGVRIAVPPAVIIATDIFDAFLDMNDLRTFALQTRNDEKLIKTFTEAPLFPENALADLRIFLERVRQPLAIRSSGMLEDSHVHPFAGVYETYMLPNCDSNFEIRFSELIKAIKKVYASTYSKAARDYFKATAFRIEDEKMAVIVQQLCGSAYGTRFYPAFSGTAQSYNFYPVAPQKSEDGIASISLGLGKMVVEGGRTVRFSPKYPKHIIQFSTPKMALENNQHHFFALELCGGSYIGDKAEDFFVRSYSLSDAEKDGTLYYAGSTYSPDNDTIYDGISRPGIRMVTFSPVLKYNTFPLPDILKLMLDLGSWAMGTPVDIEFAVNMSPVPPKRRNFSILQIRPMTLSRDIEKITISPEEQERILCYSNHVLGNGIINNVRDIVVVDRDKFNRHDSRTVAHEIRKMNAFLLDKARPYLLIGVGRWGSMDPWLGIPVRWDQIAGARVIIEAEFQDFKVDPSQGSHFLENLNSFSVGYFTVHQDDEEMVLDWDWLNRLPVERELKYIRLHRLSSPLKICMSGRQKKGVILKPL